jgi:hypothetical protein
MGKRKTQTSKGDEIKMIGEILKGGLLVIALTLTFGSVFAPSAQAWPCQLDPGRLLRCAVR